MRLTEHLFKTSGVEYGTNSNTFALDAGEEIILFDLGFDEVQWNAMHNVLTSWGLGGKKITKAFLTHGHYDHAGNTKRANEAGIAVYGADPDAHKIETGYPEMEKLFERPWVCGRVDHRLKDGNRFETTNAVIEAIACPGHSEGSFAFVIETDGHRALVTGDAFFIIPQPPLDAVDVDLAFMGGEDFSLEAFASSLKRMSECHCDLLLTGHYYVYYGDIDALCRRAYEKCEQLKEKNA